MSDNPPLRQPTNYSEQRGDNLPEEESNIGRTRRLQTYATLSHGFNNQNRMNDNVGTFFTQKQKELRDALSERPSFDEFRKVNNIIRQLQQDIVSNEEPKLILEKLRNKLVKIDNKTFNWPSDSANIKYIKTVYEMLSPFNDWSHFKFIDITPISENLLPIKFFLSFLEVPYHSEDDTHIFASSISEFYSDLLVAFERLYLLFPTGNYPKIDSEQLELIDPFMRQGIRELNQQHYQEIVEKPNNFRLIDFLNKIIDKFILENALRWTDSSNSHVIVPIFQLILNSFTAGLIKADECPLLMDNIYMASEVIAFVEDTLRDNTDERVKRKNSLMPPKNRPGAAKVYEELMTSRILISKIVLQVICTYSDHSFVRTAHLHKRNLNITKKEALKNILQKNKELYKHICLVFLKYLSPRLSALGISKIEADLEKNNNQILLFLTNYNQNFFINSVRFVHDECIPYYFDSFSNALSQKVLIIVHIVSEFLHFAKNHTAETDLEIFHKKFEDICDEIMTALADDVDLKLRLELTKLGITRFILHSFDVLHVGNAHQNISTKTINCITAIMKKNYAAQSLLFRGATHLSYLNFFKHHKLRCMNMILDIFKDDYLLFDLSNSVFDIKIDLYEKLLSSFRKYENKKEDNDSFRLTIGTLRFFNSFLEDILKLNLDNPKHRKRYDIVIQLKIVDIITDFVLPAFANEDFLRDFALMDLQQVSNFSFTLENVRTHNEYFKNSSLRLILYELYFTFLKLFVGATTYAYPKIIYDKIVTALRAIKVNSFYFDFPTGIILRMFLLKLNGRFLIFPNNHILYESPKKNETIIVHRKFVPENNLEIRTIFEDEFKWIGLFTENPEQKSPAVQKMMTDYLLRALLPSIYKYFRGINSVITIIEERSTIVDVKFMTYRLLKMLLQRSGVINNYLHFEIVNNDRILAKKSEFKNPQDFERESLSLLSHLENSMTFKRRVEKNEGDDKNETETNLLDPIQGFSNKNNPDNRDDFSLWNVLIGEENLDQNLGKIRSDVNNALRILERMYDAHQGQRYHIDRFRNVAFKQSEEETKSTDLKNGQIITSIASQEAKTKRDSKEKRKNIVNLMRSFYRKQNYNFNPYKNAFIWLLTINEHHEKYNRYLADGCVSTVSNLTSGDNASNFDRCFYINKRYMGYFQSINTLMHYSPNFRVQLYNILRELKETGVQTHAHSMNYEQVRVDVAFLRLTWSIMVNLTVFIYYKTFKDKYYDEFLIKYHLMGSFIQNLFMNNFVKFKLFLNERGYGILKLKNEMEDQKMTDKKEKEAKLPDESMNKDNKFEGEIHVKFAKDAIKKNAMELQEETGTMTNESIFFENFLLMKEFFKKSNVATNTDRVIVPSDRANLFPVLVQSMKIVTEFVTGPCLKNQLRIYNKYMFLWNGILTRVVEDVDSNFYLVKLAVLSYIQGLLQGLNLEIVDYMSNQLQIQTFYETTIEMAKLLYVKFHYSGKKKKNDDRDFLLNDKERLDVKRAKLYKNYDKTNHFETIDEFDRKINRINSPKEMLELYKFDDKFNSHNIIQVIVNNYVLMRTLSDKIKFWFLYLEEKEVLAKKWESRSQDREKHIIFNFILNIMFDVEIVYELIENDKKKVIKEKIKGFSKQVGVASKSDRLEGILKSDHPENQKKPEQSNRVVFQSGKKVNIGVSRTHLASKKHFASGRISALRLDSQGMVAKASTRSEGEKAEIQMIKIKKVRVQRRFYYLRPPSSFFFTEFVKGEFLDEVPLHHTVSKQLYIYKNLEHIKKETEDHKKRITKYGFLAKLVTGDAFVIYELILIFISLALNILMLATLENPSQTPGQLQTFNKRENRAITGVSIALIVASFIVLALWISFRWKIEIALHLHKKKKLKPNGLTKADKLKIYLFESLIFNTNFNTFLINFVVTILGITVYRGIYNLNLFLAVKIFKPLTDIFRALTDNASKLLATFVMMVLLVYFFAFVILVSLPDRLNKEVLGPQNCRDLFTCFLNTFNTGIRAPGGIAYSFELISDPKDPRFWLMWFINLIYLFIVKLVVEDIVAGIIVETFGELRDERNEREHDEENYCMICGMDRWESEKKLLPFRTHVKETHNKWNYFYFLIRLISLPKSELVGFEFDVINQYQRGETKWFPHKRFLTKELGYMELKEKEDSDSDSENDSQKDQSESDKE